MVAAVMTGVLVVGCSRANGARAPRWLASCEACPWRTTGLVSDGVDRKTGDRCPRSGCKGRITVQTIDPENPAILRDDESLRKPQVTLEPVVR